MQFNIAALHQAVWRNPAPPSPPATCQQPRRIEGATPGCYALELSDEDYHYGSAGVSSSHLKQALRSAAHYQAWLADRHRSDTPARRFGRAVHCYLLERDKFAQRYAIWRGGDRRSSGYKDFEAAHPRMTVLTEDEAGRVTGCCEALLSATEFPMRGFLEGARDDSGNWLLEPARCEFTIFWTDESTGLQCKARLDAFRETPLIVLDVKTCGDARPAAFERDIGNLHYDLQAAFYMEAVRRFTGQDGGTFLFAAVEADAPHAAVFYALSPTHDFMANGARKYRYALDLLARCGKAGHWPAYGFGGIVEPTMHHWQHFQPPSALSLAA